MLERSVVKLTLFIIGVYFLIPIIVGVGSHWDNKRRIAEQAEIAAEIQRATNRIAKNIKPINLEQLKCLATNIYHEAGHEPFIGQVAVARVVMNRIKHGFAASPCRVVYQANEIKDPNNPEETKKVCQFSWVCEGKVEPSRNAVYLQAEKIARAVLSEDKWREEIPSNVLFFHNTGVQPNWVYRKVMTIGNHIFYSK